jgi:tetratricopeptide (TPR) repeat protein
LKASPKIWTGLVSAIFLQAAIWGHADTPTDSAPATTSTAPVSPHDQLMAQANQDAIAGKMDKAVGEVSVAIQMNEQDAAAYELRGAIYIHLKIWDKAERDYTSANKISPDPAYQYKIAEIRYLQKDYDNARPLYAALESDNRLGDLALFRVYLCDMLGYHRSIAATDLALIDQKPKNPSHFYAHGIQCLFEGKRADANKLFAAAGEYFGKTVEANYLSAWIEAQDLNSELATFTTRDGRTFTKARVFLESGGLRVLGTDGWVTVPMDQLPDDLSVFSADVRAQILHQRDRTASAPPTASPVTFTTKSGQTYENVRWEVGDDGLSVLTPDSWRTVPFTDLPADTSSFPKDLQTALRQKREAVAPAVSEVISFTTRDGRHFDNVRAELADTGVRVLTDEGTTTISARDLPGDLSPFPAPWRVPLRAAAAAAAPARATIVSFTSKTGQHYDDVRAAIEDGGLRLTTPDGLIQVPWKQVPDDLSPFPPDWRDPIAAAKKIAANPSKGAEPQAMSP